MPVECCFSLGPLRAVAFGPTNFDVRDTSQGDFSMLLHNRAPTRSVSTMLLSVLLGRA